MPVYSLGSNGSGQLALGHVDDVSAPSLSSLPATLDNDTITSIKAGGNHTLILTASRCVYATGSNTDGRCALDLENSDLTSFIQTNPSSQYSINLIAATWEASIFASVQGPVFVCGSGAKGELGLGMNTTEAKSPQQIPDFPPSGTHVIHLAACMAHVVAVLSNGEVYGWGNGLHGQLGEPNDVIWQPRRITGIPFTVCRAVCGKDFTCVFEDPTQGRLQIIGLSKRDRYSIKANTPATISGWKDVQATWGGVYVLLSTGKLLAWGRDDHGQLPLPNLPSIRTIAAGSEHMLALTESGNVLAWGWGEHGNCALPTDECSDVKGRWNELDVVGSVESIGGGCATSWVVTS